MSSYSINTRILVPVVCIIVLCAAAHYMGAWRHFPGVVVGLVGSLCIQAARCRSGCRQSRSENCHIHTDFAWVGFTAGVLAWWLLAAWLFKG